MKETDAMSLPKGWEIKKLEDVCHFVRGPFGGSLKKSCFKLEGYAIYEQQHAIYNQFNKIRYFIDDNKFAEMQRFELFPNDLIMSCSGTMGKVAIVPSGIQKGIINQALLKLTPSEQLDVSFLKLWMESDSFYQTISENSVGAAIKNVASVKILKQIPIPIPPLPEQKRIVSILDRAFEAIDKAKANAEQNFKNAKELFESYLQGVFEKKGDDWEEKTLGQVCKKIQDGAHHSPKKLYPNKIEGVFPYITSKNIRNNYMDLSNLQYVDEIFHLSIYPRCTPEIGDVLLTKDGANTGNITVNTLDEPFSLLSSVCLIKPNKTKLLSEFIKYYIQSPIGFKKITGKMTGAAIKRIILREVKSAVIPIPPLPEQQQIVQKLDALSAETKKLESIYQKKIADLEELKKSILKKAFEGDL